MTANPVDLEPDPTGDGTPPPPPPDLSVLMPDEGLVVVEGEVTCRVRRMRAHEVLSLAKVVAAGIGSAVTDMNWDFTDRDEFSAQVLGMLAVALPNAEEETFAFLSEMLVPVNPEQSDRLVDLMSNPSMDTVMDELEVLVAQEGPSLLETLGKARRLASTVGRWTRPASTAPTTKPTPSRAGRGGRSRGRST